MLIKEYKGYFPSLSDFSDKFSLWEIKTESAESYLFLQIYSERFHDATEKRTFYKKVLELRSGTCPPEISNISTGPKQEIVLMYIKKLG